MICCTLIYRGSELLIVDLRLLLAKEICRRRCSFPTVKGYKRSGSRREGGNTNPFFGSEGPQTDPEQVSVLCLLRFPFFPLLAGRVRVRLTSSRLSIFLGPLYPARNWFSFPHIRGPRRSLGGKTGRVGHQE